MTIAEQIAMEEYPNDPRWTSADDPRIVHQATRREVFANGYARGQQYRWISVADRLPEELPDGTNVLGWNSVRMEPVLATLRGGLPFDVWNEGWDHKNEITHWVELPSPPNPEQR